MGFIQKLLGIPVKEAAGAIGDLIGKFVTDPDKKMEATIELTRIEQSLQMKLLEADVSFANAQADVVKAEATSASWLTRNWRPLIMVEFGFIIAWNYIIAPIFGAVALPIPEQMWDLLQVGMSGYIVGRSLEKAVKVYKQK